MTGLQQKDGNNRSLEASGSLHSDLGSSRNMAAGGILVKGRVVMHTQWNFEQTHDIYIFIKISVVIRLTGQIAESIESLMVVHRYGV